MKAAAILQLGSKYITIVIQLVVTMVLARLVTPEQFGLLAIVTVFTALFSFMSDIGLSVSIVQFRDLSERDIGSLFVFTLFLGLFLTSLFCLLSWPIAYLYGNDELIGLLCFASVSLFFSTINMVPNGQILKDKNFISIAIRLIVSNSIAGVIAIILAFNSFGCYALVTQINIVSIVIFIWNFAVQPIKKLSIHFMKTVKHIFSYTAYQFGFNGLNYLCRNFANLVIGKAFGMTSLGFYDKAYQLSIYPNTILSGVIGTVIQPYMAEKQDDSDYVFENWKKISKFLSLCAVPISLICICAPHEIITVMYGSQWENSVFLFQLLSISIYVQMVFSISGAFFQSMGHTDFMFRSGLINTILTIAAVFIGIISMNIDILCLSIALVFWLQIIPISYYLICKTFRKSCSVLKVFLPELIVGCVASLCVFALNGLLPVEPIARFLIKVGVILVVTGIGYLCTKQFKYIKAVIFK